MARSRFGRVPSIMLQLRNCRYGRSQSRSDQKKRRAQSGGLDRSLCLLLLSLFKKKKCFLPHRCLPFLRITQPHAFSLLFCCWELQTRCSRNALCCAAHVQTIPTGNGIRTRHCNGYMGHSRSGITCGEKKVVPFQKKVVPFQRLNFRPCRILVF